jgi:MFS transporter, AAHS family, vanillate permease
MNKSPRDIILHTPMGALQIAAIALCIGLTALDGFDVLSISFASPGIAAEWGVDRGTLGVILSAELIGMALGSAVIGGIADKIGRRPTILGCLVVMIGGMILAATAGAVTPLLVYRFCTGLGIGGMLASVNAMTAEYSNAKRRNLAVTLMAAGYPAGVIFGGTIASMLLRSYDWPSVFVFGAILTACFLPLVWYFMPESIEFLQHKRPPGALERINRTLGRMGHAAVDALPVEPDDKPKHSVMRLFSPGMAKMTVLLTLAYFAHIMTFYFYIKWIPKLVVDMGFHPSSAGGVLVWSNVGGISGAILLGLLTQKFGVRGLVIITMVFATVFVAAFGHTPADLSSLSLVAAAAGFFTNAGIVGLYAMFAQSFPTELRASGTGFVIGVGRGGAALAPIIAGYLFVAGMGLPAVSLIMGCGSLLAIVMLLLLKYREPTHEIASGA